MKYTEATQARPFMLRLEDGEIVHEATRRQEPATGFKRVQP